MRPLHVPLVLAALLAGPAVGDETTVWRLFVADHSPRIAVAGDRIAVTDPLAGRIRLVDAEAFTLDRDLETGGMPYNIVAVGGSGEGH